MSLQQLWLILKSRIKLLLFITITTILITFAVSKIILEPYYNASTTLLIDFEEPGIDSSILPAMLQEEYMTTQLGVLKSTLVAERAVQNLGYPDMPLYQQQYEETYGGTGSIEDWLEEMLKDGLRVRIVPKSRLIKISYSSIDPQAAADVANAFSQAFREVVLSQNLAPVKINASMLDEQLAILRKKLKTAKDKLNAHQKEKNVLISEDRLDIESLQLKTLTEKLALAKAEVQILQSRLDQINSLKAKNSSLQSLPEVMTSQQVRNLQTMLYAKKTELAELSLNIGVNHPQYKSVAGEIKSLEKNIRSEEKNIINTMETELKGANDLVRTLEKAKDDQKRKVIELKQGTGNLPALIREVESAQRNYEKALTRVEDNNLLAQIKYTNVTVIDPAKVPDMPDGPVIKQNLMLSAILGLIMGLFLIVVLELKDRKLRSKDDLLEVLGDIPLLGSLKEK